MSGFSEKVDRVVDCHIHLRSLEGIDRLIEIREHMGVDRINLLGIVDPGSGSGLAQGLVAKARHPGVFYSFGGLNHAAAVSDGAVPAPPLAEQVELMAAGGCDGIKLIEGKPTHRRKIPFPLDGDYYRDFFAAAERADVPVLWHVADPEEFWDPDKTPAWALEHGWGYGDDDVPKEQLYAEVENVLRRHPKLRVIFAHFYFLSADLARAERFLKDHPSVNIDVTPGIELMFNLSREPAAAREFFLAHQDRIFYGTDISSGQTVAEATGRAGLVRQFLESSEPFAVPSAADDLLEPGGAPRVVGLDLPPDVLTKIYRTNFESFTSPAPKPIDLDLAVAECRRHAEIAAAVSGAEADETEAGRCAQALQRMTP